MEYVRPFTFLFRQSHAAATLATGSVLMFVPIAGPIVLYGWALLVYRALLEGREEVPPLRFADFSRLLQLGLGPWVVALVVGLVVGAVAGPVVGVVGGLAGAFAPVFLVSDEGAVVFLALWFLFLTLAVLVVSSISIAASNIALVRAELGRDVGTAFQGLTPGYVLGFLKLVRAEVLWSTVATAVGSSLVFFLGLLALYFGIIPASIVVIAAGAHFRHQLYTRYLARGGTPLPVHPVVAQSGYGPPGHGPAGPGAGVPYGGR